MKKLVSFLLALSCASVIFAASLRDYVGVVRPNISEKTTSFLTEYKDYLISKGYKTYANQIDGYLKGSFGSGFIIYGSDGKPYVLTNRHVISEAETANVQFENEDGSISEYKDLTIIASDEDIDIALIALPSNFKKPGLTLSTGKVNDGDDVWSAGFPGLGSDPVWQLGKGVVSNSRARIKELLDPSISTLIQHSAQIDGGNSGGPLMVANSKASAGYSVIGINTWKAIYRENTNFAIPASVIKTFMDNAIAKKSSSKINDRLSQFAKTVANKDATFTDMSRYISNEMVAVCGGNLFIKTLQKASNDVRSTIVNAFAYDPIEGLRFTLAYYVYTTFTKNNVTADYTTGNPVLSGAAYKVVFTFAGEEGKEVPSFWIEEHGNWKLNDFDNLASEEEETTKKSNAKKGEKRSMKDNGGDAFVTLDDSYALGILGGYGLSSKGYKGGFLFDFNYGYQYFAINMFAMKETVLLKIEDAWGEYIKTAPTDMTTFGLGVRVQVPVNFNYVIVEPYAEGKVGFSNFMSIKNHTDRFYVGYGLGLDVVVNAFSNEYAPVVGFKYIHSSYKTDSSGRFGITAGIKCDF